MALAALARLSLGSAGSLDAARREQRAACRANSAALLIQSHRPSEAAQQCEAALREHREDCVAACARAAPPHPAHAWYNLNTALRQLGSAAAAIERTWRAVADACGDDSRCAPMRLAAERRLAGGSLLEPTRGEPTARAGGDDADRVQLEEDLLTVVCVKWGSST